jgi:hypothetical protein
MNFGEHSAHKIPPSPQIYVFLTCKIHSFNPNGPKVFIALTQNPKYRVSFKSAMGEVQRWVSF